MARILIAEDVPDIAEILRIGLEREKFEVVITYDGKAALAAALAGDIDLAILDVRMPGLDGMTVLREVRATTLRRFPIILLTALISPDEAAKGYEAGADAYIFKPFHLTEVVKEVRKLLPTA